eukprot:GFKZ01012418.1.p1 GENE.GFKZ01012418.1~~GFKZ01012418.1.p1  ORF type:complete len:294 (+),score=21.44 GFKZ01012418.1:402-1283(+)
MATSLQTPVNYKRLGDRLESSVLGSRFGQPRSGALIVLDLHGVLVNRVSRGKHKNLFTKTRHYRSPWRMLRGYGVWLRPFLHMFLQVATARHEVAVWSSAQPATIEELFRHISAEYGIRSSLKDDLSFVWSREQCRLDRETGGYATVKYIGDIWSCDRFGGKYTSKNTLLLDDSPSKFRQFPLSGIAVPPYCADQLGDGFNGDDTLLWLLLYVEYLLETSACDQIQGQTIDIASNRFRCIDFDDFVAEGKRQAYEMSNRTERKKSLAFVFIGSLVSALNSRTATSQRTLALQK